MQISDIDISLSLGQLLWKRQWRALVLFMITPSLFPLLTVLMIFLPIVWDVEMVFVLITMNIAFLLIATVPAYVIIKDCKNKEKIKLWLDGAVKTKAYSKKIGESKLLHLPKGMAIQVSFKIGDNNYTKDSTVKVFGGGKAHLATFNKYADRAINILYSQKYDEVLILKDQQD